MFTSLKAQLSINVSIRLCTSQTFIVLFLIQLQFYKAKYSYLYPKTSFQFEIIGLKYYEEFVTFKIQHTVLYIYTCYLYYDRHAIIDI